MKKKTVEQFISLWKQAAEATRAANEIKNAIRDETLASFFEARHGQQSGEDTVRIETESGTVLVSFTRFYRALDESEREAMVNIVGPMARKHFKPSWTVSLEGLTEAEAKEIATRFGDRAKAEKVYTAGESWHVERHSLVPSDKLIAMEREMKVERVNVSVAK